MTAFIQASCQRYTMPPSASNGRNSHRNRKLLKAALEFLAVKLGVEAARRGELKDCNCVAKGLPMPCKHVEEFRSDRALLLLIERERTKKRPLTIRDFGIVGDRLAEKANPRNNSGYHESFIANDATDADPHSPAKIEVLQDRIENGEAVYRPGDAVDDWFIAALERRVGEP